MLYVVAGVAAGGGTAAVGASLAYNYVGGTIDPDDPNVPVLHHDRGRHERAGGERVGHGPDERRDRVCHRLDR